MALPRPRPGLHQPGAFGDFLEKLLFQPEEVEFLARDAGGFRFHARSARILRKRPQRRAGQLHPAGLVGHLQPGQHPESLRIALVTLDVGGFVVIHHIAHRLRDRRMGEPVTDRLLSGVAERRIADVVRERGGGDRRADVARLPSGGVELPADEDSDRGSERTADRTGFQTVGEAGPHIIGLGQREHLSFVLQPAERAGKDDPVEVALERRPVLRNHTRL